MIEKTFLALKETYLNTRLSEGYIEPDKIYTFKFKDEAHFNSFKQLGIYDEVYKQVIADKDKIVVEQPEIPVVDAKKLECDSCGIVLIETGTLIEDNVEYKIYTCPMCKKEIKELSDTTKKEINTLANELIKDDEQKAKFICGTCGKVFIQQTRFEKHKCK